jgi:predicted dehydrogenase
MNTPQKLRVAVVGVGHLGRHHARILSSLPDVDLVGVADRDRARAAEIAGASGTRATAEFTDFLGSVDAVTVAVPTEGHLEVARPFLERGVAVLVEKPLARSLEEADAIIAAAARSGATLAVGHTERHNPAVRAARVFIDRPRFIEVHRLGTFPERSLDIDVVFDLMIHDLDVVRSLVGSEVASIEAVGVPVLTGRVDIANARLRFENGCIANITASRISRDRVRKIRLFQANAYISIDYASQEVEMYKLVRPPEGRHLIDGGRLEVPREEPLRREIVDFLEAVRTRRQPEVTGADGRSAVALAQAITDRMASLL